MNNRQTFLERLTGTRVIHDDTSAEQLEHENTQINNTNFPIDTSQRANMQSASAENDISPATTNNPPDEDENDTTNEEEVNNEEDEESEDTEEDGEEEGDGEPTLAIDMYESDNELVIQSMIAGVTPENLHITITRNAVTIQGKRVAPQGIPKEHFIEQELYWGTFSRHITLPFEIDADDAEAVEKYGLLIIRLPRLEKGRSQELKVKSI